LSHEAGREVPGLQVDVTVHAGGAVVR
jgi:hypothetical protein